MKALKEYKISLDVIRNTKIGVVLKKASQRQEFASHGEYASVGGCIGQVLRGWTPLLDRFMRELGLL